LLAAAAIATAKALVGPHISFLRIDGHNRATLFAM